MEIFRSFGFDKPLFVITVILLVIGSIMVFSSSAVLASQKHNESLYFFIQQLIGAAAGLAVLSFILTVKKPFFQSGAFIYALLILSVSLLAACFIMPSVARVNRWVGFFGLRFQPSELAKISLVLFLAYYLERKKDRLDEWRVLLFPIAVMTLTTLLIIKEPDYGTALLIFVSGGLMLYLGGVKLRYLAFLGVAAVVVFAVFLFSARYRVDRITSFMSPEKDIMGKGFQPYQSKLAVGSGGLVGVSLGESRQKLYFLPYAHTDFIYAILGEEFGLLGTVTILLFFLAFLWRGLVIGARAPTPAGQLAAVGLTLIIGIQALLNITVVLGMGPAKGVPLPLISFGRSSLVCTLAAIGIILNISQRKKSMGKHT
ncbi:MAG: putative lipid II flippase FtsW [Candidatus Aminicenantes bacterium]|nr:putative lipid II flippase FtsW [Candidatus Aminicenantes bacterium]